MNRLKNIFGAQRSARPTILGLALALCALCLPATINAQVITGRAAYSTGGTAVGTTLSYAIISGYSFNGGTPTVTYISGTSDKAGSVFKFYNVGTNTTANFASSSTSIPVQQTNGFAANDIIVIQHAATDTYERRVLAAFTSATNLTTTVAPTVALSVGDKVFDCNTNSAATIPVGNATKEVTTASGLGGIYAGQPGLPLLIDLDMTSAGQINTVTAVYLPNR